MPKYKTIIKRYKEQPHQFRTKNWIEVIDIYQVKHLKYKTE